MQLADDVLNERVSAIAIQASDMADLLRRADDLDEMASWVKRAVCFIGAAGQGETAAESADQLIYEASALLSGMAYLGSGSEPGGGA